MVRVNRFAWVGLTTLLSLLLLAVTSPFCLAQQGSEANLSPLLFVSKTISSDDIVLGSSVTVTVTVTNYGQSPAFDVEVLDLLEDGKEEKQSIASLAYGASMVLRYRVTPRVLGNYPVSVAQVTYHEEKGKSSTQRLAFSNMVREGDAFYGGDGVDDESFRGVISVLTRDRYDRLHARYIKETTAYLFLGAIPALFPYVLYRVKRSEVDAVLRRGKGSK